ncbi:hypothetical protein EN925_03790 [Mesorhizobium sp. M7A.F.Ca.US.006.04.2.1]|uniref:DUF6232 family protein n=1 Tax=unclassified Mesorhizobium TaxID=325217 RepID=UPI000FC998F2|nr:MULTISPECIES: DUF6232 family protein [unclassified Mesorhizobium]RUX78266.1 hypothetical protein EN990_02615 [Mesorhizobium sp. M7A.F.Ca.US.005.03.1.1]RUY18871.1 hypothetical protein EN991_02595 [Mesorhizobium sp. M7A.F.Ca.US.005.03.2.1]RUY32203.1 hypothetical protein EN979_00365 [Mesorhizobium sp. M7A.F.Ca.US.001.04.2.1]RUY43299.1 hypothetical protein EN978_09900 [Mesorhizobium sp. M7A.F.Ca.US.001.04.1.1]RVA95444.1 hypothetical protein EN925_03790 [Mesorhizobium sp. M7A.F.Ca.US.006.04.2.1]
MEKVNFTSGGIHVTDATAIFGNVTYQISSIGSVSIKQEAGGFGAVLILVAIIFSIYVWMKAGLLWGVLIFFGLGFATTMLPSKSTLVLRTSSGDVHVLSSHDKALVSQVKGAIEQAFKNRESSR